MSDGPKTEMLNVGQLTGDSLDVAFVVNLPGSGPKRYPMRQSAMRLGRSDQSDIVVKDSSVSSRHCDFIKEGGAVFVRDLGSSNGTFVNEERVTELELRQGDVLRVGNAVTVTVQIGNAPVPMVPTGPVDNEVAGSTMMISAGDLDAMRQSIAAPPQIPAQPPPRRAPAQLTPAYPSAPMQAFEPTPHQAARGGAGGSGNKGLIIGLSIGLVVIILGGIGGWLFVASTHKKQDIERLERMKVEVAAIGQTTPCTAVQDSVSSVAKLDQSTAPPTLPARPRAKRDAEKFLVVQNDLVRQYDRIVSNVEQLATTTQLTVDRVKLDVEKIRDPLLKAKADDLAKLLDERSSLTADFIADWRKLKNETEYRARLVDTLWIQGRASGSEVDEYSAFDFSRPAPRILGTCRILHDKNRKDIESKLEELARLVAN